MANVPTLLTKPISAPIEVPAKQLLIVGANTPIDESRIALAVGTGREAIQILRMLKFDVMLICSTLPDMTAWELAAKVRHFWPWQRWMYVAADLAQADEQHAYQLGAAGVFESIPSLDELVRTAPAKD